MDRLEALHEGPETLDARKSDSCCITSSGHYTYIHIRRGRRNVFVQEQTIGSSIAGHLKPALHFDTLCTGKVYRLRIFGSAVWTYPVQAGDIFFILFSVSSDTTGLHGVIFIITYCESSNHHSLNAPGDEHPDEERCHISNYGRPDIHVLRRRISADKLAGRDCSGRRT